MSQAYFTFGGHFHCHPPTLTPNAKGNRVIILQTSFGPMEVLEWGINADGKPYSTYKWLEDDFLGPTNHTRIISKEEFIEAVENMKERIKNTEFESWNTIYDAAVNMLND